MRSAILLLVLSLSLQTWAGSSNSTQAVTPVYAQPMVSVSDVKACQEDHKTNMAKIKEAQQICASLAGSTTMPDKDKKEAAAAVKSQTGSDSMSVFKAPSDLTVDPLDNCYTQLSQCDSPATGKSQSKAENSDDQEDSDKPKISDYTFCEKMKLPQRMGYLQDQDKDLRGEMKSATDEVNSIQDQIAKAQEDEEKQETQIREDIEKAQQDMTDQAFQFQEQMQKTDQDAAQKASELRQTISDMNSQLQDLAGPQRMQLMNNYANAARQIKLECEQDLKTAIQQNGAMQVYSLAALAQSSKTGGTDYRCNTDRKHYYQARDSEEKYQVGLQQLQQKYAATQAKMANLLQDMQQSAVQNAQTKSRLQMQSQAKMQQLQQTIQRKSQQLMQTQARFQQKMQMLQLRLAKAQQQDKVAQSEYQDNHKELQDLKDMGVKPSRDDSTNAMDDMVKKVREGIVAKASENGTANSSDDSLFKMCLQQTSDTAKTISGAISH